MHCRYGSLSEVVIIGDGESIDNKYPLLWRDIISMGSLANNNSNWFVGGVKLRSGGGDNIKLWREKWLCTEPLMHVFHILYSVAANKHASVIECGSGNWSGADLYLYARVYFCISA